MVFPAINAQNWNELTYPRSRPPAEYPSWRCIIDKYHRPEEDSTIVTAFPKNQIVTMYVPNDNVSSDNQQYHIQFSNPEKFPSQSCNISPTRHRDATKVRNISFRDALHNNDHFKNGSRSDRTNGSLLVS